MSLRGYPGQRSRVRAEVKGQSETRFERSPVEQAKRPGGALIFWYTLRNRLH